MTNKTIFAANLKRYMDINKKTRREMCEALGVSYYTFSDWVNAKKYPRMDKVESLANYFGIQKSDLIEEKMTEEKEKDNDILADIIVRMRIDDSFFNVIEALYKDEEFFSAVKALNSLDTEKSKSVVDMLKAFGK